MDNSQWCLQVGAALAADGAAGQGGARCYICYDTILGFTNHISGCLALHRRKLHWVVRVAWHHCSRQAGRHTQSCICGLAPCCSDDFSGLAYCICCELLEKPLLLKRPGDAIHHPEVALLQEAAKALDTMGMQIQMESNITSEESRRKSNLLRLSCELTSELAWLSPGLFILPDLLTALTSGESVAVAGRHDAKHTSCCNVHSWGCCMRQLTQQHSHWHIALKAGPRLARECCPMLCATTQGLKTTASSSCWRSCCSSPALQAARLSCSPSCRSQQQQCRT